MQDRSRKLARTTVHLPRLPQLCHRNCTRTRPVLANNSAGDLITCACIDDIKRSPAWRHQRAWGSRSGRLHDCTMLYGRLTVRQARLHARATSDQPNTTTITAALPKTLLKTRCWFRGSAPRRAPRLFPASLFQPKKRDRSGGWNPNDNAAGGVALDHDSGDWCLYIFLVYPNLFAAASKTFA